MSLIDHRLFLSPSGSLFFSSFSSLDPDFGERNNHSSRWLGLPCQKERSLGKGEVETSDLEAWKFLTFSPTSVSFFSFVGLTTATHLSFFLETDGVFFQIIVDIIVVDLEARHPVSWKGKDNHCRPSLFLIFDNGRHVDYYRSPPPASKKISDKILAAVDRVKITNLVRNSGFWESKDYFSFSFLSSFSSTHRLFLPFTWWVGG